MDSEIIYQDLLNNWYSLKIKVVINATNIIDKGNEVLAINIYEGEEEMLESVPEELFITKIITPEKQ